MSLATLNALIERELAIAKQAVPAPLLMLRPGHRRLVLRLPPAAVPRVQRHRQVDDLPPLRLARPPGPARQRHSRGRRRRNWVLRAPNRESPPLSKPLRPTGEPS